MAAELAQLHQEVGRADRRLLPGANAARGPGLVRGGGRLAAVLEEVVQADLQGRERAAHNPLLLGGEGGQHLLVLFLLLLFGFLGGMVGGFFVI